MKVDKTKKASEKALTDLAAALERGKSATLKAYLAAMARFHNYNVRNLLLIMNARPHATKVAGFHTWKRLGRRVKRGEKGIAILAPVVYQRELPDLSDQPSEEADTEDEKDDELVSGFRTVYVFDASQTDGRSLPEFARAGGNAAHYIERLRLLLKNSDIDLVYSSTMGDSLGASCGGRILIRGGLAPAEEFGTIVHELAHERLHRDEALRSRTVRETEAEAVALVVGESIGLDSMRASADYIHLYNGDAKNLIDSLDRIRGAANWIIVGITGGPVCGGRSRIGSIETNGHGITRPPAAASSGQKCAA